MFWLLLNTKAGYIPFLEKKEAFHWKPMTRKVLCTLLLLALVSL